MLQAPTGRRTLFFLTLILFLGISSRYGDGQQGRKPYTKEAIVGMLKGEVAPHRVAVMARERGIDFQITPEVESELRRAGATDALLATLRELALKPSRPAVPPAPKVQPAQIVVQTSPDAQVYLDDTFKGQASPEGRLVIANPAAGQHTLRVSLAGKKDYEKPLTVSVGQATNVDATLADIEKPTVGSARENPKDGLKYVWIPPGTFMMGCSPGDNECEYDEKPAHEVTITKGFWIGQTEVTVAAYKRFSNETGHDFPTSPDFNSRWRNDNWPIVNVTWDDAKAYCVWSGGRLPTEAEWEYAARAGSTEARYGDIASIAWSDSNSGGRTHNVGEKRANGFGLYDMFGNVWEWVSDWYNENYYESRASQDPSGPPSGTRKVVRGGSFANDPSNGRASSRGAGALDSGDSDGGLRCVGGVDNP
jgi:formylglycine-generating enzyme required for sulfatase activity